MTPLASDVGAVFDALSAGDVASALDQYAGPLLPQSVSPAVARLRTELATSLRAAVLATGSLLLLRRWLELPEGRDDRDGWRMLHDSAATKPIDPRERPRTPRRPGLRTRLGLPVLSRPCTVQR